MTDGTSGTGGPSDLHGTSSRSSGSYRRVSYASVASGSVPQDSAEAIRPGFFAHMATTVPSTSIPQTTAIDHRLSRTDPQEQEMSGTGNNSLPQLPLSSRKYFGLPGYGSRSNNSSFFVPSYLRDSRYVARLEVLHTQRLKNEREPRSGQSSIASTGNQSSSNANVHRIAPSHRGMTYEVIESNPPKDEEQLLPLPTRWSEQDKHPHLELSNEGLDLKYDTKYNGTASKSEVEAASIRADFPMVPACGIYYYEIEIKSKVKDCAVAIGFSSSKTSLERLPGWEPESWAYHDDGKTFSGEHNGRLYNFTFAAGDVVGCGINFHSGQAFFTKNGQDLGVAFREMKNTRPFPCVGIKKYSGAVVSVNFGQRPFMFDIDDKVAQEKMAVENQILKTKTTILHPKLDEMSLVEALVSQFLLHGGYVEASKVFEEEMRKEKRLLNEPATPAQPLSDFDTVNATNRQQIRRAILAGDIDVALEITTSHYPEVLERSPDIVFHLKCRKWIELISKAADLRARQHQLMDERFSSKGNNASSKPFNAIGDVFDQHMELDNEQQSNLNGTGKTPVKSALQPADTDMAYNQLLTQAMDYGQALQRDYRNENDTKTLQQIFSLIAYDEPRESVRGHLLDVAGRVKVAEELNSAILVFLGRSPTAVLENVYKQTEALLDVLGTDGGPASFVNLTTKFQQSQR